MGAGFYASKERWRTVEAPLLAIEGSLRALAARLGASLEMNAQDWPVRSLKWDDPIVRKLDVALAEEENLTYNVWIFAWRDRGPTRFLNREPVRTAITAEALPREIDEILSEAVRRVEAWEEGDLKRRVPLSDPHL